MRGKFLILFGLFICWLKPSNAQMQKRTPNQYLEAGRQIWQQYVPSTGQAATVQGELLRSIENLADEAQRNGNLNFRSDCHRLQIEYLRQYLTDTCYFQKPVVQQINQDLDRLLSYKEPYLLDDIYDRLRERVIDWCLENQAPIPHILNKQLKC